MQPALDPRAFRFDPPSLPDRVLARTAEELFGVRGSLTPLRGERDQNRLLVTGDGERLVLKVSAAAEDPAVVDLQARALLHLERVAPELSLPRLRPTLTGAPFGATEDGRHLVRLLTWLDGITYEEAGPVSRAGLRGIGAFQGRLCRALARFEHHAADHFMPWDIANRLLSDARMWALLEPDARALTEHVRDHLVETVVPAMATLRRQVVHNDAHRGNLLRADPTDERVVGLIDFGDLVRAPVAADLAICAASFVANDDDPAGAVAAVAAGFHGSLPLEESEIDLLYDLVLARLVLTTLLFAFMRVHAPAHHGHLEYERPLALAELSQWLDVDPARATATIRQALAAPAVDAA